MKVAVNIRWYMNSCFIGKPIVVFHKGHTRTIPSLCRSIKVVDSHFVTSQIMRP